MDSKKGKTEFTIMRPEHWQRSCYGGYIQKNADSHPSVHLQYGKQQADGSIVVSVCFDASDSGGGLNMLVENFLDDDEHEDEVADVDWNEKESAPALSSNGRLTLIIAVLALIFSLAALMVGIQNLSTTHETQTVSNSSAQPFRKVLFKPDRKDPLEGDCTQNGRNMHVRLVSLETLGDKAILTTKVINNSKRDDFVGFPIMVFQNGYQTSAGDIGNSRLKAGQSETIKTTVNVEDPSKPIALDVNLYSQKLQVGFKPTK